jgi:GAF domain-containing protein
LIAATSSTEGPTLNIELKPIEARIAEEVLRTGQVLVIEDLKNSPYVISRPVLTETSHPLLSAICLPVAAREYKFGTAILAYESQHHYTNEDRSYAERVGYQIALALWTVQQDEISQQQLIETKTLMQIGQTLAETERVGLDVVLQLIVDSARKLIPQAQKTVIHLVDEDNKSLVPQAISAFSWMKRYSKAENAQGWRGDRFLTGSRSICRCQHGFAFANRYSFCIIASARCPCSNVIKTWDDQCGSEKRMPS